MDVEEADKVGFLLIPPQGFLRKTWLKRYCAVYNASNHGIQRIELFESEDAFVKQNPSKIIPLTDCIKVSPAPQKQQPNVFEVRTKNAVFQFSADTFQEMSEWLTSLQCVAFGKKSSRLSSSALSTTKEEKQEENMLYSSMEEPEIYSVKAVSTEATLRNNLVGDYKLIITPLNLSIAEENPLGRMGRIILTWPYRHIRRYGCTTENFSFEAGRKCVSGEGLFTFSTSDGMLIFQSVDAHVLALKSSQHEIDMPSSPCLNQDKIFFTSKDSLSNKFPVVDKHDQVSHVLHGNNSDVLDLQNKVSQKVAPLSKPPRKSKSKITYGSATVTHGKDNSKYSPNLYEELYTRSANHPVLPHQSYNSSDESNLSLPDEKMLCYNVEKLHMSDVHKQCDSSSVASYDSSSITYDSSDFTSYDSSTIASYDYENCDRFLQSKVAVPKPVDHIYGKIINTKNGSNTYGTILPRQNSIAESISSPVYSNVPTFSNSYGMPSNVQRDPEHFVKNDVEYAQVYKKNENSFM